MDKRFNNAGSLELESIHEIRASPSTATPKRRAPRSSPRSSRASFTGRSPARPQGRSWPGGQMPPPD